MVASRRPTAVVEGGDYLLDLEATNLKEHGNVGAIMKRIISHAGEGNIDENYASFLNDLVEHWEAKLVDEDEDDPTYVRFLNNLKEYGNAYMLDVSDEDGVSIPIKYEVEDDDPRELKRKIPRSQRSTLDKESRWPVMDIAPKLGVENFGCQKELNCRHTLKEDTVDEAYRIFMNGLKVIGESVVYEYEDGKRLYYEMCDEEGSADVEVDPLKEGPRTRSLTPRPPTPSLREPIVRPGQLNPLATTRHHHNKCSPSSNTINNNGKEDYTWFREKLKLILKQPFSREEYENFLRQVQAQSPVEVHKETRTGGYKVPGQMSKSYLDTYTGLKREIEQVKSHPHKVLNLLRGFIYWLQSPLPLLLPHLPPVFHQLPNWLPMTTNFLSIGYRVDSCHNLQGTKWTCKIICLPSNVKN